MHYLWLGMIATAIVAIYGWILNIIALVENFGSLLTVEIVLRVVGVVIVPIGAVMGLFF